MSLDSRLTSAADRLWEAQITGVPCAPVRDLLHSVDQAYAVQQHNVSRMLAEHGGRLIGRKIGLTSPPVQRQLGVDQPDYGALFAHCSSISEQAVTVTGLLQPKVEAEVAVVLGADLDLDDPTPDDVRSATDHVLAGLEIVDSRIAGWDITLVDTVADNASSGRIVLGTERFDPGDFDLAQVEMTMSVNGVEVSKGTGAECLGSPWIAAQWLARTMARLGTPLRSGDVVLTGALGPMAAVTVGDRVDADLGALGTVGCTFVAEVDAK